MIEARLHAVCLSPRHVHWPSTSPARVHPAAGKRGIGSRGSGGGQGLQNCSISRRLGLLSARDVLDPAHCAVSGRLWATPPSYRPKQADGPMSRAVGTVKLGIFLFVSTRLTLRLEEKKSKRGLDWSRRRGIPVTLWVALQPISASPSQVLP